MTHICDILLEHDETSLWEYTCEYNDFQTPADLRNIEPEDFNDLSFDDPNDPDKGSQALKTAKGGKPVLNSFKTIRRYMIHLINNGQDVDGLDWTTVTQKEHRNFVHGVLNSDLPGSAQMHPGTTPTNTSQHTSTGQYLPLTDAKIFKKSVCCDSTLFQN